MPSVDQFYFLTQSKKYKLVRVSTLHSSDLNIKYNGKCFFLSISQLFGLDVSREDIKSYSQEIKGQNNIFSSLECNLQRVSTEEWS